MTKYDHNFDRKRNCWTTPIYFCAQGLASWWMTTVLAFSTTRTVCVGSFVKVSLLTIVLLYSNTWTSSHFIEFEFHRVLSSVNMNFSSLSFSLEMSLLSFGLNILSIMYKFYRVQVSQNYKPSNSNFIEFEIWVVKLSKFE